MNFRQFAFRNVVRNMRAYVAHFLSSTFSVMAFFIFSVLMFHPDLQGQLQSSSLTMSYLASMGLKVSQYFIFLFSFLFLLYSSAAFLKVRKKEFGILAILGMSERQRKRLTFVENMLLGLASIIAGIGIGLLFTKLLLLISERVLMLDEGLRFYVPLKAIGSTAAAFAVLFIAVSLLTVRVGRRSTVLELLKSDEKPRTEPKASAFVSFLAIALIGAGYGMVYYFVERSFFSLSLLAGAIACVVAGTYFLFTQLSVYTIHLLKRRERILFKRINLLTLTDLAYRMRDNAVMFFMVASVMAVAFSAIGVCLTIGDPERTIRNYPYAFTYHASPDSTGEDDGPNLIGSTLEGEGFQYRKATITPLSTERKGYSMIPLSQYNELAAIKDQPIADALSGNGMYIATGGVARNNGVYNDESLVEEARQELGAAGQKLQLEGRLQPFVLPQPFDTIVLPDELFGSLDENGSYGAITYFAVPEWKKTLDLARKLDKTLSADGSENGSSGLFALSLSHFQDRQLNGILLIICVLMGMVFFTFAASFLYFRLYSDKQRDERQYEMIGKIGLSVKELKGLITRQLSLMFFLPLALAAVHSLVAFHNLANLANAPMLTNAVIIFSTFLCIQAVYFLLIRWRYLGHMRDRIG
ncbi:ABC transporter permease [Paenibacillus sp. J5C_2022]|uniref:FtsX-like permease family protein n=1 Tax=Paenibacillus sp. J5C2022 TaxID=2977129 RepID=UPI0021D02EC6|nr:ABC transporter permease [Paenibacillus sp. J5C2022]MCU6710968.1 ABC transporter permease [Paenibacillus sp. J5C2022]